MKFSSVAGLKVAFIAMLPALPGCAKFTIDDAYRPSGKEDFIEMAADDAKLRVSFAPEGKFFSLGLLVPIVPLGVSVKRGKEVEMKVLATLPAGLPFSFAPVCLDAPPARLCPKRVEVGIAYYYGGPSRLSWEPAQPWQIDVTTPIDAQAIFDHRPFRGEGAWERVQLELSYLYSCENKCPDEISLSTDELLLLEGRKIGAGVQQFRWRRKSDSNRSFSSETCHSCAFRGFVGAEFRGERGGTTGRTRARRRN
jgi:hypothetical protein